ncbi:MAG: transposase family protein [Herbinix sp.]|jgi:hypothetical protein|nr:transposase family protein [Herbinix sp.]
MLLYNAVLRSAHRLKEWLYDICQNNKYFYQREGFWEWVKLILYIFSTLIAYKVKLPITT